MLFRNFLSVTFAVTLLGAALAQVISSTHRSQTFRLHERALDNYPKGQASSLGKSCSGDKLCWQFEPPKSAA